MFPSLNTPSLPTIQQVWEQYRPDLLHVEEEIQKHLLSDVPLINQVSQYILSSGGKRIRPLLMILSARLCPAPDPRHIILASVVEYIHTATLLHDDVIDEGDLRRGRKTARTLWGNQASILAGDYLYATGVAKGLTLNHHEVNRVLQNACCRMIEGEMAQSLHNGDMELTESEYLEIIQRKTASLIAAACRLSGLVSAALPDQLDALEQFGLNLGMAFQVADDLLDYTAESERLGKTLGADLKEGKITLPLLHVLRECPADEKNLIARMIGSAETDERTLARILDLMNRHGSLRYAREAAAGFVERAKNRLSCFEPSAQKTALDVVADYVVSRDH